MHAGLGADFARKVIFLILTGLQPGARAVDRIPNRFNGNNIFDSPVFAPEEQYVYSTSLP